MKLEFTGISSTNNAVAGSKRPAVDASKKPSNLMPVTVAMMLQADHNKADDLFNYKGVDIHMVQDFMIFIFRLYEVSNKSSPPIIVM